ncbi:MAG: UDP-N-acetylmuramate dehydrogenase [Acidimicrobiia bacterium]|nr:UDP-N-acetylmuramate dehydrogenase [Acidimicrobiia bacterium]
MSLADLIPSGLVRRDHSFSGSTTYKFGGPAAWYAEVDSDKDLEQLLDARRLETNPPPVFVLGKGSNVVIADAGYAGLVIKLSGDFNLIASEEDAVVAGAAVSLPRLARFCAAHDRGGLEFYVGIPGTVGGAVVMNAGGHGSNTAEWLIEATVVDIDTGAVQIDDPASLGLAYRHSRIGPGEIVVRARFRTIARPAAEGERLMREITAWRREHQPGGTFNAGSVFKNPPGDAAGRIIDAAGLKGLRCGGVSVSERHANFFVADGEAKAQDVYDLVMQVKSTIEQETGVELEPEIRFIGEFGDGRD